MSVYGNGTVEALTADSEQQRDTLQFLTFLLGNEIYGIEILKVQEIKGWTPVTAIPNSPNYIKGILNLRGEIVPIYDIRIRFNLEDINYNATTVIIVITVRSDIRERTIGLVVDGVWDVVNFTKEEIKPSPDLGENVNTRFISGLANIGDRSVMLLESDQLFSEQEAQASNES